MHTYPSLLVMKTLLQMSAANAKVGYLLDFYGARDVAVLISVAAEIVYGSMSLFFCCCHLNYILLFCDADIMFIISINSYA